MKELGFLSHVFLPLQCWQYVSLFGRVHLIDCPGVVHATGESEADTVLRSVVRVEDLLVGGVLFPECQQLHPLAKLHAYRLYSVTTQSQEPEDYISEVLERVERKHLVHTYGIQHWVDHFDFLEKFARKAGRLLKVGTPLSLLRDLQLYSGREDQTE